MSASLDRFNKPKHHTRHGDCEAAPGTFTTTDRLKLYLQAADNDIMNLERVLLVSCTS